MSTRQQTPRARAEVRQVARAMTWAQDQIELTDKEVAAALGGVSTRTIARWREKQQRPQPGAVIAAETMLRLATALEAVFGTDKTRMQEWLHEPVKAFKGQTPLRLITGGNAERVVTLLANVDAGTFD